MKALHYALAAVVATAFGAAQASLPGAPLDPNPTHGSTVAVPLDQNGGGNGNVPVQRIEPPAVPPVPNVPLEPELTHDVALRALLVTGDPGCGFVLVAGFDPAPFAWFPGVHNTLDAVAIVQIGFLDMLGRERAQERPRPGLVLPHEARIADHIGAEYGGQASFHRSSPDGCTLARMAEWICRILACSCR